VVIPEIDRRLPELDRIAAEVVPLIRQLPPAAAEYLSIPDSSNWWRILFHLAWHFPRTFLKSIRQRVLTDGKQDAMVDETACQLDGMREWTDVIEGTIYGALEHDAYRSSEAAVRFLSQVAQGQTTRPRPNGPPAIPDAARRKFADLRGWFERCSETGKSLSRGFDTSCKFVKLADSFTTPPASEWAQWESGGCVEKACRLSRLDDHQEFFQIRGPATGQFLELATEAGCALPAELFPDKPVLFNDTEMLPRGIYIEHAAPYPVMVRDPFERWVGFVYSTIRRHRPEALTIWWGTREGPMSYGMATLDRDIYAASALAIDLAGLVGDEATTVRSVAGSEVLNPVLPPMNPRQRPAERLRNLLASVQKEIADRTKGAPADESWKATVQELWAEARSIPPSGPKPIPEPPNRIVTLDDVRNAIQILLDWVEGGASTSTLDKGAPGVPAGRAGAEPLSDGPHPPTTFAYNGLTATMEPSALALLKHMYEVRPPGTPRMSSGVAESEILKKVFDNSASSLKSHCFKANQALKAVFYPYKLSRREVPGSGWYISWEGVAGQPGRKETD
jgi:hypothetical protein